MEVRYFDINEDAQLDEELLARWIRQASALPGWSRSTATSYAKNQIPSQVNSHRLPNDSQTAGRRQQQASLTRDEHG
jgi:hypothetical protein